MSVNQFPPIMQNYFRNPARSTQQQASQSSGEYSPPLTQADVDRMIKENDKKLTRTTLLVCSLFLLLSLILDLISNRHVKTTDDEYKKMINLLEEVAPKLKNKLINK